MTEGPESGTTKDFMYRLKSKKGTVILESIVTFGSEDRPFPEDWENSPIAQIALQDYKEEFINRNFDIEISQDLNFKIKDNK